jgi:hypothetical protein
MAKRRTPPSYLTEQFREVAFAFYTSGGPQGAGTPLRLYEGGPACWLKQFDPLDRPCSGELEAFHFIGRQRIRSVLRHQLALGLETLGLFLREDVDDLVELAEWDSRNGGPACTGHHRRFDSHATPALVLPAWVTPGPFREFIREWGLETEVERKFSELERATHWLGGDDASPPSEAGAAAGLQQQKRPMPRVDARLTVDKVVREQPLAGVEGDGGQPSDVAADQPGASLHSGESGPSPSAGGGAPPKSPAAAPPDSATPVAQRPDLSPHPSPKPQPPGR